MFNAGLEQILRALSWEEKGISINGEKLHYLRFADDIVLISNTAVELQTMLEELYAESTKLGLKINMRKIKVMFNAQMAVNKISISN